MDPHQSLNVRTLVLVLRVIVGCSLSLFFVSADVAHAETLWAKVGEIGAEGSAGGAFATPGPDSVAIDSSSGDAYVSDGENRRVQKFELTEGRADFLLAFGWGVREGGGGQAEVCLISTECKSGEAGNGQGQFEETPNSMGVAVAPNGDVYVVDTPNNRVEYFSPAGIFLRQFNGTEIDHGAAGAGKEAPSNLSHPTGVAIDAAGNVYVTDGEDNAIDKFSATGDYECQITGRTPGSPSECSGSAGTPSNEGFEIGSTYGSNIAVNSSGDVYLADTGHGAVDEFGPEGRFIAQFGLGTLVRPEAVAVDSAGDVFALAEGEAGRSRYVHEYEPSGTQIAVFGAADIREGTGISTRGEGASERVYVADREGHRVLVFGPGPTCETLASASGVGATTATVQGAVEPNGTNPGYQFEYGLDTSYGAVTALAGPVAGSSGRVPVTGTIPGPGAPALQPNQTYHYQLTIIYGQTVISCGPDETLKTLPAPPAIDHAATLGESLTASSATVVAAINPNNEEATYYVEYSTITNGGALEDPATSASTTIPPNFGDQQGHVLLSGLQASATYYYRVVATDAAGTSEGPVQTLATLAPAETSAPTRVTQSRATLTGTFIPAGSPTAYYFQYGPTASYGQNTPPGESAAGSSPVPARVEVEHLAPLTTYHYRLVVHGEEGTSYGHDREFTTLWPAVTGPATEVTSTTATLSGEVIARGLPTSYQFEYGTTEQYGATTPVPSGDGGVAMSGSTVSVTVNHLSPDTTYHYRLVTMNASQTGEGEDRTFTTDSAAVSGGNALSNGLSLSRPPLTAPPPPIGYPMLTGLTPIAPARTASVEDEKGAPPGQRTERCKVKVKRITHAKKRRKARRRCAQRKSRGEERHSNRGAPARGNLTVAATTWAGGGSFLELLAVGNQIAGSAACSRHPLVPDALVEGCDRGWF